MNRRSFASLLVGLFVIAFLIDTSSYSEVSAIILLCIALASIIALLCYKDTHSAIRKVYFRPIHIFLLSYVIVFFQTPIDILLGYNRSYYEIGRMDLMPECVRIAVLGLLAFFLGYLNRDSLIKVRVTKTNMSQAPTDVFKILMSLLLILIVVVIPRNALMGGYHTSALDDSIYSYLSSWVSVFMCAFFIQHTINMRQKGEGKNYSLWKFVKSIGRWQNLNVLLYCLMILNIGDRGPIIVVTLIYYISYISVTGTIPSKKIMVTGFMVGVIVIAFLGYTKRFREANVGVFDRVIVTMQADPHEEFAKESISPQTAELAGSYRCLSYSVADMKGNGEYAYGRYQLQAIVACIPFASGLFNLGRPSSNYISHLIQGDFLTYGNGTSIIADFYLDGGLIGVVLLMFIFGYFVKRFEEVLFVSMNSTILIYCIAFYFSIHFISVPRSFLLLNLKYSVWLALFLFLNQKLSSKKTIIKH